MQTLTGCRCLPSTVGHERVPSLDIPSILVKSVRVCLSIHIHVGHLLLLPTAFLLSFSLSLSVSLSLFSSNFHLLFTTAKRDPSRAERTTFSNQQRGMEVKDTDIDGGSMFDITTLTSPFLYTTGHCTE